MQALHSTKRWAKAHPAETAAIAVGAAAVAWLFWPRERSATMLAPLAPKPALPAKKAPRVPGNTPRAQEANAVIQIIERLPEGTSGIRREGPYTFKVRLGPYTVAYAIHTSNAYAPGAFTKTFPTMAEAKKFAIALVVTRRSAFALNNHYGCRYDTCDSQPVCGGQKLPDTFTHLTNGLTYIKIEQQETLQYIDLGGRERGAPIVLQAVPVAYTFQAPLPVGYVKGETEKSRGRCSNPAICGDNAKWCAWLKQDFEIWSALRLVPYAIPQGAR